MAGGGKGGGGGGGATSTINLGGTTTVDSDSTIDIQGLDNIKTELTLKTDQPFKTESKQELVLPQPLKTDSHVDTNSGITLDIKPLVVDVCLNLKQGPVQPTCIRQPYQHHFGVTLFGMEVWGFNFCGESQTIVQGLSSKPQVAWGGEESRDEPRETHGPAGQVSRPASGLRIRLDG